MFFLPVFSVRHGTKEVTMSGTMPALYANRRRLFRHLHRGGVYAHLWTDAGNRSHWFRVDGQAQAAERTVPRAWRRHNVYFTVHPLAQIPPANTAGSTDPRRIASQLPYIAALNALFAEFDGKDFVLPLELVRHLPDQASLLKPVELRQARRNAAEKAFYVAPARFKARALAAIRGLAVPPSVIVDSGGGYHCYWLLATTVPLDDTNRADLQAVQHAWVQMVGADPGASDLRRVLRVPGTFNTKPGFGAHPPRVEFVEADFTRLYELRELEEAVNDWLYAQRPRQWLGIARTPRPRSDGDGDGVRSRFNRTHAIADLLVAHGYRLSFATRTATRLARPGRDATHSSVTVFPAREDGTPELAVHFSTNDPLYSDEYLDAASGGVRRRAHDAFHIYGMLEHDGDWPAAYAAARAMLQGATA
jgi:hypothetical protein